jgi:hypothetical protein
MLANPGESLRRTLSRHIDLLGGASLFREIRSKQAGSPPDRPWWRFSPNDFSAPCRACPSISAALSKRNWVHPSQPLPTGPILPPAWHSAFAPGANPPKQAADPSLDFRGCNMPHRPWRQAERPASSKLWAMANGGINIEGIRRMADNGPLWPCCVAAHFRQ